MPEASPYRSLPPRTLSALIEASAAINATLEPATVLSSIARMSAVVMRAEASSVLTLDRRRKRLVFRAAVGDRSDSLIGEEFDADLGIAGRVVRTAEPQMVQDVRQSNDFFRGIDDKSSFQTRGIIAAPLVYKNEVLGVVEVLNKENGQAFDDDDLALLQIFANLAAHAAHNADAHETLVREKRALLEAVKGQLQIIGSSPALRQVQDLINRVAASNATVLLLGETGTGKEVTARQIHSLSPRRDKAFIAINCAALPETLLESELFGHEKGSFTGAISQKIGRFELADGGTLFLDEIGELPLELQPKLLRVLENGEFQRVGETQPRVSRARVIAATNRDLRKEVREGRFRADLFHRLSVFAIDVPPLRDMGEDKMLLLRHYRAFYARQSQQLPFDLDEAALARWQAYAFPGNVRELRNIVIRLATKHPGQRVGLAELEDELDSGTDSLPSAWLPPQGIDELSEIALRQLQQRGQFNLDDTLLRWEQGYIQAALRLSHGNVSQAARLLGINRTTLYNRMEVLERDLGSASEAP